MPKQSKPVFNIFCHYFIPHVGGIEQYCFKIARQLAHKGFTVNVITCKSSHKTLSFKYQENKFNVYSLSCIRLINGRFPIPWNFFQIRKVAKECFLKNPNSISLINSHLFVTSLLGLALSYKKSSKVILVEHGSNFMSLGNFFLDFLIRLYEKSIISFFRQKRVLGYGVSNQSKEWLTRLGVKTYGILPNGVDSNDFIGLDFSQKQDIILFAGRTIKQKGIFELLNAFIEFNKIHPKYKLIVIGKAIMIDKYLKHPKILFTGELEHKQVLKYMAKARVFINPSKYPEGMTTTVLEALYCRCIVICSKNCGIDNLEMYAGINVLDSVSERSVFEGLKKIAEMAVRFYSVSPKVPKTAFTVRRIIQST